MLGKLLRLLHFAVRSNEVCTWRDLFEDAPALEAALDIFAIWEGELPGEALLSERCGLASPILGEDADMSPMGVAEFLPLPCMTSGANYCRLFLGEMSMASEDFCNGDGDYCWCCRYVLATFLLDSALGLVGESRIGVDILASLVRDCPGPLLGVDDMASGVKP